MKAKSDMSNLPEVQYELRDDGMLYAVDPEAAKTDHVIIYENNVLAIARVNPSMTLTLDDTRGKGCASK